MFFESILREGKNMARILVVEDDEDQRKRYAEYFEDKFEVALAGNGQEALDMLKKSVFDVILSDVNMPGMGGLELYDKVGIAYPCLSECFIFVTGNISNVPNLRETGRPYLIKPFGLSEMMREIYKILEGGR